MHNKVILLNYSEFNQFIIWGGYKCNKIFGNELNYIEKGIAGYTESEELVGVFIRNSEVFF